MMFLAVMQIVLLIVMLATALYVANILDQWRAEWHTSFVDDGDVDDGDVDDGDVDDGDVDDGDTNDDC